jgi:hypothetical protein
MESITFLQTPFIRKFVLTFEKQYNIRWQDIRTGHVTSDYILIWFIDGSIVSSEGVPGIVNNPEREIMN